MCSLRDHFSASVGYFWPSDAILPRVLSLVLAQKLVVNVTFHMSEGTLRFWVNYEFRISVFHVSISGDVRDARFPFRRFTVNILWTKVQNKDALYVLVQDHNLILNLINYHFHLLFWCPPQARSLNATRMQTRKGVDFYFIFSSLIIIKRCIIAVLMYTCRKEALEIFFNEDFYRRTTDIGF